MGLYAPFSHIYFLPNILLGDLISIFLGFLSSGIIFSKYRVRSPLISSAPFTTTSSDNVIVVEMLFEQSPDKQDHCCR